MSVAEISFDAKPKDLVSAEEFAKHALKVDPGRSRAYTSLAKFYSFEERWSDLDQLLAAVEKN